MRSPLPGRGLVSLVSLATVAALGCAEPIPRDPFYPMREPNSEPTPLEPRLPSETGMPDQMGEDEGEEDPLPPPLPERPTADPEIERALKSISASGRRFVVPDEDPDADTTPYTAEQFAGMLRTKWDWLGYDLVEIDPWLDEVATETFKGRLPYQVELEGGELTAFRPWLDAMLQAEDDAP